MAKQTFKTPLNFQEVNVGSLEDKVLMRTADGDIKELPSDSFGGGGSQTLDQVLGNGNTATLNGGTATILGVNKSGDHLTEIFTVNSFGDRSASIELKSNGGNDQFSRLTGSSGTGTEQDPYGFSEISVGRDLVLNSARKLIIFEPVAPDKIGHTSNRFFIPEKDAIGENYYFATRDEINLQKVLDNNSFANFDVKDETEEETNYYSNIGLMDGTTAFDRRVRIHISNPNGNASDFDLRGDATRLINEVYSSEDESYIRSIAMSLENGVFRLVESNANYPQGTNVRFKELIGDGTQLYFPSYVGGGEYTLATTADIKLKSYTVSTLPTGKIGDQAYVTDATAPTYLGTLIGGGSIVCPVFYNGTTWVSH